MANKLTEKIVRGREVSTTAKGPQGTAANPGSIPTTSTALKAATARRIPGAWHDGTISVVPGHTLADPLRAHALGMPEAYEDHPWGENVAKVGKKVFVFFGLRDPEHPFGLTVKLPDSYDAAMSLPWAKNPGYRMDRGHWVWLQPPEDAPLDMLTEWIEESYRAVAPKRLLRSLDPQPQA